jgi:hypothetical protein
MSFVGSPMFPVVKKSGADAGEGSRLDRCDGGLIRVRMDVPLLPVRP